MLPLHLNKWKCPTFISCVVDWTFYELEKWLHPSFGKHPVFTVSVYFRCSSHITCYSFGHEPLRQLRKLKLMGIQVTDVACSVLLNLTAPRVHWAPVHGMGVLKWVSEVWRGRTVVQILSLIWWNFTKYLLSIVGLQCSGKQTSTTGPFHKALV